MKNQQRPLRVIICEDNRIARRLDQAIDSREKSGYVILSTNGHLQIFQNSSIYKWTGIDPQKIIQDENSVIAVLNAFNKKNYYTILNMFSDHKDQILEVILAITPDLNSLMIALKEVNNALQKVNFRNNTKKIILDSLALNDLSNTLKNPEDFSEEDRIVAEIEYLRSYLDAVISFSITQEITYTIKRCFDMSLTGFQELRDAFKQDMKDGKNLLIPMSRAQALILQHLYDADNPSTVKIRDAQPKDIFIKVTQDENSTISLQLYHSSGKDIDGDQAERIKNLFQSNNNFRVKNVTSNPISVDPPKMFDLTGLIVLVSEHLGFPTTYTYKILLDLYYQGLITYPNAERARHHASLHHEHSIEEALQIEEFEDPARKVMEEHRLDDADMMLRANERTSKGICPIVTVSKEEKFFKDKPNHWKIYELIYNRYLMQFFKPAQIIETSLILDHEVLHDFHVKSYAIENEGFHRFFKSDLIDSMPNFDFNVLKSINVMLVDVKDRLLPVRYTDASLLEALVRKGLGDTVSYLLMIEKLISNNYIQVINKTLKLTKRGELISEFFQDTFDFLGKNDFSLFFSNKLHEIESVDEKEIQVTLDRVKRVILDEYLKLFQDARVRTNNYLAKHGVDFESIESRFTDSSEQRFPLIQEFHVACADCGSPMKVIETKTGGRFLACENRLECGKTVALPRTGDIEIISKVCKICGKNIMKIEAINKFAYFFCPTCWTDAYNHPESINKGYCPTCNEMKTCWFDDRDQESEHVDLLKNIIQEHEKALVSCPRCQKSPMVIFDPCEKKENMDSLVEAKLVCDNPFCGYTIPLPRQLVGNLYKSDKKCMICPMNAVIFKKDENTAVYMCLNCYTIYKKNKAEEIGFCLGCVYYDACFKDNIGLIEPKMNLKDAVMKNLEDHTPPKQ